MAVGKHGDWSKKPEGSHPQVQTQRRISKLEVGTGYALSNSPHSRKSRPPQPMLPLGTSVQVHEIMGEVLIQSFTDPTVRQISLYTSTMWPHIL